MATCSIVDGEPSWAIMPRNPAQDKVPARSGPAPGTVGGGGTVCSVKRSLTPPGGTMAVRDALLALLTAGPAYGFQLHGGLASRTGGRRTINVGQTYATLERLTKQRLVEPAGTTDDGLPLHRLTAAGAKAATAWLEGADAAGADPWDETRRPRADRPLAARLRRRRRRGRGTAPVDGATRRGIRSRPRELRVRLRRSWRPATRPTRNAPSPPSRGWRHPRNSRVRTPRSPGSTCWAPSRDWPTRPAPTGRGGVAGRARPPRRALSRPTRSCRPPRGRGGTRPGSRRTAAARRPAPTPPPRRPPRRRPRAVHAR